MTLQIVPKQETIQQMEQLLEEMVDLATLLDADDDMMMALWSLKVQLDKLKEENNG